MAFSIALLSSILVGGRFDCKKVTVSRSASKPSWQSRELNPDLEHQNYRSMDDTPPPIPLLFFLEFRDWIFQLQQPFHSQVIVFFYKKDNV